MSKSQKVFDSSSRTNVVYCFDKNYSDYAAISTFSAHTSARRQPNFYWLIEENAFKSASKWQSILIDKGVSITIILADIRPFRNWVKSPWGYVNRSMYLRLLIPKLISVDDAVYLDSDTLVIGDIGDLHEINPAPHWIAAVRDIGSTDERRVGAFDDGTYVNSGVLRMDLAALRSFDLASRATELYPSVKSRLICPDQDLLNILLTGKKLLIGREWNFQVFANRPQVESGSSRKIIHFVGAVKPWSSICDYSMASTWWRKVAELNGIQPKEGDQISWECLKAVSKSLETSKLHRLNHDLLRLLLHRKSLTNGTDTIPERAKSIRMELHLIVAKILRRIGYYMLANRIILQLIDGERRRC